MNRFDIIKAKLTAAEVLIKSGREKLDELETRWEEELDMELRARRSPKPVATSTPVKPSTNDVWLKKDDGPKSDRLLPPDAPKSKRQKCARDLDAEETQHAGIKCDPRQLSFTEDDDNIPDRLLASMPMPDQ